MSERRRSVEPADVGATALGLTQALAAVPDQTLFDRPIAGMEWTARRTVDHLSDALLLYGRYVATRATSRRPPIRDGRPNAPLDELIQDVVDAAVMLQSLLDSMLPDERAFHPAGFADRSGWAAMACDELIVHGCEVATTVEAVYEPDLEVVDGVVRRLFPWAPDVGTSLDRLMWANGRSELGDHPRLDRLWYWWCRPLSEWDGTRSVRKSPPAW